MWCSTTGTWPTTRMPPRRAAAAVARWCLMWRRAWGQFEAGAGPKKDARIALAAYVLNRIGDCGIQLVNPRVRE